MLLITGLLKSILELTDWIPIIIYPEKFERFQKTSLRQTNDVFLYYFVQNSFNNSLQGKLELDSLWMFWE